MTRITLMGIGPLFLIAERWRSVWGGGGAAVRARNVSRYVYEEFDSL